MGQLKQFDRLLQLGRHDELLVQLHLHFHLQRHVTSFLVEVRIQKFIIGFSKENLVGICFATNVRKSQFRPALHRESISQINLSRLLITH